jgi:hypothetical protein
VGIAGPEPANHPFGGTTRSSSPSIWVNHDAPENPIW